MPDVASPEHECRGCGARYYGEQVAELCEASHVVDRIGDALV